MIRQDSCTAWACQFARLLLAMTGLLLVPPIALSSPATSPDDQAFFETRIRPLLMDRCYKCHSAQTEPSKGGLRVDTRAGLLKGGESGKPAIIPGDAAKSRLVEAIRYDNPDLQMPPKGKLTDEQIADIIQWINTGATDPRTGNSAPPVARQQAPTTAHWAFRPLRKPKLPSIKNRLWPISPIDRFVLAKLEEQGFEPVADVDKPTLIRRATFDLSGLPPTPDEVHDFVNDTSPNAFAKVVDRLLASARYGERWGRHWMDVVRYADTAGDNADYPIPEARLYRDYIIDSFNADKPYDCFVREQIAGDILAKRGGSCSEQIIATGFLALSRRYATAPFELWHLTVEDTIETTGRAFMGLTLRCARCHDHKYDPITKEDYYGLYGFFASTQYPYAGSEEFSSKDFPRSGFVPLAPPARAEPMLMAYRKRIEQLQKEIKQTEQEDPLAKEVTLLKTQIGTKLQQLKEAELPQESKDVLKADLAALEKQREARANQLQQQLKPLKAELGKLQKPGLPPDLPGAYAVSDGKPTDEPIHLRGEPDQKGPVIKRRFPKFLAGETPVEIPEGSSGRLQLAEWLTRPDQPLTARVMVNRIWQHHFGKGIVATPSNFGVRGAAPTHPELLDYLALQFIDSGWSVKAMHRVLMLSRTYQLSSADDPANAARDPANQFYWRTDRRRLDAEPIRDSMLAVAGNLDLGRPGEHPFPPIDTWKFTQHSPFKATYQSNHRSVYLMTQRIQRHPYLALFDAADANTSTDVRTEATVPQQALYMMNNRFVLEQATALAAHLIKSTPDPFERVREGVALLYARPATKPEIDRALAYIEEYQRGLAQAGAPPDQVGLEAWTSYARVLLSANEFVFVD